MLGLNPLVGPPISVLAYRASIGRYALADADLRCAPPDRRGASNALASRRNVLA